MAKTNKEDKKRLIVALLLTAFYLGFILVNVNYLGGVIFMALDIFSLFVILNWEKIPKKEPNRGYFAFEKDWILDLFIGAIIGVVVYATIKVIPGLSLVAPTTPSSAFSAFPKTFATIGQWLNDVGGAPMVEEVAFRSILFGILYSVIGLSFFISAISSSVIFSLYHINRYAGEIALNPILSNQGAFVTAFLVGLLFCYVNKWRGSVTTSMGAHAMFNTIIIGSGFVI